MLLPILLGAALAQASPAEAAAPPAELLAAARARKLGEDRHWLRLGHWRRTVWGGYQSEADGPEFFLSPRGQVDPQAELEATLAGFWGPDPADPRQQHPLCRFPARLAFLSGRLGIDPARLPERACPRLAEWWSRTAARGVTLVFSSYYMNNPASAFGHTFLRLDRGASTQLGERVELVDQGIDYAATVDTGNALLYALKGLAGLFKGEFGARPYFYKVREYADFESRDLWEYQLDLPPAAVALLVAHLWELGSTWFDYYYVTENCSYHILGVLEAADPSLELLAHVGKITIPAETVKALYRNPGLVKEVHYRPSVRTQLEHRVAPLSAAERDAVLAVADRPDARLPAGLDAPAQARVLDAALDLVDVRLGKAIIGGEPAALARRQAVLARRAGVPVVSPALVAPPPPQGGPERGHGAARAAAGFGGSAVEGPFAALDWRIGLHDLADPPAGFSPATQLEFLRTRLRLDTRGGGKVRLDEATFVEAASMTPLDRLDPRVSWRMRVGALRVRDGGCPSCVAFDFQAGGGATVGLGPVSLLATADGVLQAAPDLSGPGGVGARAGLGPGGVARLLLGSRLALLGSAGWRWWPGARPDRTWELSSGARLHLGRVSLFAEARRTPVDREVLGGMQLFY